MADIAVHRTDGGEVLGEVLGAAPGAMPAPTTSDAERGDVLRVALCGAAGWFMQRAHVPAWQRLEKRRDLGFGVRVVAAFCRPGPSAARARKRLGAWGGGLRWYDDFEALLADGGVDVLDIALPIPAQLGFVRRALAAGKGVLSEKPACAAFADGARLLAEAARRAPCAAWSVLENWACKPAVLRVLELLECGAVGLPRSYAAELHQRGQPEAESWRKPGTYEGFFLGDVGVHLLRALRLWFGELNWAEAAALEAHGAAGSARLAHSRDARKVEGSLSWSSAPHAAGNSAGEERAVVRIVGSAGRLEWQMGAGTITLSAARPGEAEGEAEGEAPEAAAVVVDRVDGDGWVAGGVRDALLDAARHAAHALGLLRTPAGAHRTAAAEGLRDLAAVVAICQSAARAGARAEPPPVRAPLVGGGWLAGAMSGWAERAALSCECGCEADVVHALARRSHAAACAPTHALAGEGGGGRLVAVVGACHSWAPPRLAACPAPSLWLHVRALSWVHVGPRESGCGRRARVGAGTSLRALVGRLRAHGCCLPSLPMHLDVTVGGALSCGAHGSSLRHGCLSDYVTAAHLVTPAGGCVWLAEDGAQAELLAAARVSCGALGVLTAFELQLSPLYAVRRAARWLPLGSAQQTNALLAAARAHQHAWAHWRLGEERAQLTLLCREPEAGGMGREYDGLNWFGEGEPGSELPADGGGDDEPVGAAAGSHWVSCEYALPASRAHEAVEALRAALGSSHRGRLVELKLVGPPLRATLLACNSGCGEGGACCFNLWWRTADAGRGAAAVRPFEEAMQALGATPHWGKAHGLPPGYADRAFGASAARFRAVARSLDPSRLFAPDWC